MSADNGHYVIKMPNGKYTGFEWHVLYASAIENLFYGNDKGNPIEVIKMLDRSPRFFDTERHAFDYAIGLEQAWKWEEGIGTEYGVCEIELPKSYEEYATELMPAIYEEMRDICGNAHSRWDDATRLRMLGELVELGKEYMKDN